MPSMEGLVAEVPRGGEGERGSCHTGMAWTGRILEIERDRGMWATLGRRCPPLSERWPSLSAAVGTERVARLHQAYPTAHERVLVLSK